MLIKKKYKSLDWDKNNGLIPAIIQNNISGKVLMLGYMSKESFCITKKIKKVVFFSRKRKSLWMKGEKSKNFLYVIKIYVDCDYDSILILVNPNGKTCHKGFDSCFKYSIGYFSFLNDLENLLDQRKKSDKEYSYTAKLYASTTKYIAQKVGEEAVEVALSAVLCNKKELIYESADLVFHLLVLLRDQNIFFHEIVRELYKRYKKLS